MVNVYVDDKLQFLAIRASAQMIAGHFKRLKWKCIDDIEHNTIKIYSEQYGADLFSPPTRPGAVEKVREWIVELPSRIVSHLRRVRS